MSHNHTSQKHDTKDDHGSVRSYVIGFVLSLIYTIVPYQLVVNKILTGDALVFAILVIALLQMAIQLIFFLHLGRGPKPLYNIFFFFATAGIIVVTVGASLFIIDNLYKNMTPDETVLRLAQKEGITQVGGEQTGACGELKDNHIVTIDNGQLNPFVVNAKLCDTITFVSKDGVSREFNFGEYPDHLSYGGEFEIVVDDSRPESFILNEIGEFSYHEHENPEIKGYFTVVER